MSQLFLRILAYLIDFLIVYLPPSMILSMMSVQGKSATLLPLLLFVVYNIAMVLIFRGKTFGKYFAQISAYNSEENQILLSVREVGKALYFLPLLGPFLAIFSLIFYIINHQTLHDIIAQSTVLLDKERKKLKVDE